jgi:hypothetical protein
MTRHAEAPRLLAACRSLLALAWRDAGRMRAALKDKSRPVPIPPGSGRAIFQMPSGEAPRAALNGPSIRVRENAATGCPSSRKRSPGGLSASPGHRAIRLAERTL